MGIISRDRRFRILDAGLFPYNSIGLLFYNLKGGMGGTASYLVRNDVKKSKFLITCAHNFINYTNNGQYFYKYESKK